MKREDIVSKAIKLGEIVSEAKRLSKVDGREINLRYADLRKADLRNLDLKGAQFINVDLEKVNFKNADLRYAYFIGLNLRGVYFENVDLRYASFVNVNLREAYFEDTNLTNIYFDNVDLRYASFINVNLDGAFENIILRRTIFVNSDLTGVYFRHADLRGVIFKNSNVADVNLKDTNLRDADFSGANLSYTKIYTFDCLRLFHISNLIFIADSNLKIIDTIPCHHAVICKTTLDNLQNHCAKFHSNEDLKINLTDEEQEWVNNSFLQGICERGFHALINDLESDLTNFVIPIQKKLLDCLIQIDKTYLYEYFEYLERSAHYNNVFHENYIIANIQKMNLQIEYKEWKENKVN